MPGWSCDAFASPVKGMLLTLRNRASVSSRHRPIATSAWQVTDFQPRRFGRRHPVMIATMPRVRPNNERQYPERGGRQLL